MNIFGRQEVVMAGGEIEIEGRRLCSRSFGCPLEEAVEPNSFPARKMSTDRVNQVRIYYIYTIIHPNTYRCLT